MAVVSVWIGERTLGAAGAEREVLDILLGLLSVAISVLVAVAGWLTDKPLVEMFLTGVSLAVAVVPEGLPAVVTITLALGVRAMVRRRALLRRLQAAEALGAATVICTDKTGTLTCNEMTVRRIWLPTGELEVTGTGYDPAGHFEQGGEKIDYRCRPDLLALLQTGLVCNHAVVYRDEAGWHPRGEPTEAALVVAAYKAWLTPPAEAEALTEFSFDSTRKRMTVIRHEAGRRVAHVKGAPEVILERCTRTLEDGEERPPRAAREPVLDRAGMLLILVLGGYIGGASLWLFHHYLATGAEHAGVLAQTVAFTAIIVLEKMNVFNFRSLRAPLSVVGIFSNPWVLGAWAFTIGLQLCAVYLPVLQQALHTVPMGWSDWGLVLAVSLPIFLVTELVKWLRWRAARRPG